MKDLFEKLFGCGHYRTTFPLTPEGGETYVVCLECGKEFAYDWERMRVARAAMPAARPNAPEVARG